MRAGMVGEQDLSFGSRLRHLRNAAGLTQEELALRAGLSTRAISALERGERQRPYPHTVRTLADALGLSDEERASLLATLPRGATAAHATLATTPEINLPVAPTPLVGRERELEEIRTFLRQVRLLTFTGLGGVGKTHLSLEAARYAAENFPDGIVFVALASLADPALVVPTVARSLGLREAGGQSPHEVLRAYLQKKRLLLVLDNFEHLMEAALEVSDLLGYCPDLTVLATSRAPLRLRGEREYPVPPLKVPDPTRVPEVEEIIAAPAARLFVERAQEASPTFKLTEANAAAVAAICWRLDGLPLALELAAAKVRFLAPLELLSRLDQALEAGTARDLPKRQKTMRATMDWSYELLHGPEKELFRRLSVFSGGFTLEAAEAVEAEPGATGAVADEEVLTLLGNLVEQSLVVVEPGEDGDTRYRMLEAVRQYAQELLEESGEQEKVRRRHAEYYLALAETADQELRGPEQVSWLSRLESEHGNVRVAMGWLLDRRDTEIAARLGWALWLFWYLRGHSGEGFRWMKEVLSEEDSLSALVRARASCVAGIMLFRLGAGEPASARLEEASDRFRSISDTAGTMMSALFAGLTALGSGDTRLAESLLGAGLRLSRSLADAWSEAVMLSSLGLLPLARGDYERAEGHFQRALSLGRTIGNPLIMLAPLYQLAQLAQVRDDHRLAAENYREALALGLEMGDVTDMALCLQGLAECAVAEGDHARAGRLYGASEAALKSIGTAFRAPYHFSPSFHERYVASARDKLGDRAWLEASEEGRKMPLEEAVEYALEGDEVSPA